VNAALYIRVSTPEQAIHGLSVESQRENLEQWAKQNKVHVAGVYADEGISARKPASKRPALQRLLNDVRSGEIDLVVFTKLDRWFRNVGEYYKVQEVLEQYHVNWRTIYEDYDTSTAAGRLKVNIMLSVAQDEADRTSERIKVVFETKRQKLEPLTGACPPGYKIEGKKFIKDPEKEAGIAAFFRKYMACGSITTAREFVKAEYGLNLSYQVADKILNSSAYYGRYYDVDGICPPYITKADHDKIQTMRRRFARKTIKNRVYLFSGLIICGDCGRRMSGGINQYKKSPSYHCQWHFATHSDCVNNACLGEKRIEEYLMGTLDAKLAAYKAAALETWRQEQGKNYKPEIAALKSRLGKLKELFLNDLITMEEFRTDKEEMEKKLAELQEKDRPREKPNFDAMDHLLSDNWKSDYLELGREEKREFWRIFIREIRIFNDRHLEFDLNV